MISESIRQFKRFSETLSKAYNSQALFSQGLWRQPVHLSVYKLFSERVALDGAYSQSKLFVERFTRIESTLSATQ
jgi:hypothetical protein